MEVTKKYWKTYKYAPHKDNKRQRETIKRECGLEFGKRKFHGWNMACCFHVATARQYNARAPPYDAYKTKTNTYFYGCRRYCVSRDWKVC